MLIQGLLALQRVAMATPTILLAKSYLEVVLHVLGQVVAAVILAGTLAERAAELKRSDEAEQVLDSLADQTAVAEG